MTKDYNKKQVIIYQEDKKDIKVEAFLWEETIWLTQDQIAKLFGIDRSVITKHLRNIFDSQELEKHSVCAKIAHTASDGKKYQTQFYNLDAIISVGYRVNSKKATHFRVWATGVLRDHILKGYTINDQVLVNQAENFKKLQETISFLQNKIKKDQLAGQEQEILNLLSDYSRTLSILEKYDKNQLTKVKGKKEKFGFDYSYCRNIIKNIKQELMEKEQASEFFGQESGHGLESVINGIYQTFGGKELYPNIESKSSHLLYFIIKDHPFVDGNKRIGSLLFVHFLDKNNYLYKKSGERKISDNALTALALLVAESDPKEKEVMINLIENLLVAK
jgi:prophage maintenance system killer protein